MSMLLLTKTTPWCDAAVRFARAHVADVIVCSGDRSDVLPQEARSWTGDWLISFLSPWIVPQALLSQARRGAINFHPGPPEYPGIGCYNFALYDDVPTFGSTCHHMAARVDTGAIVDVRRFAVGAADTVQTLKDRTMTHMLLQYFDVLSSIVEGRGVSQSDETWQRRPYTRVDLDALCRLTPDMPAAEVARRVRATTFAGAPGAWLELAGVRFVKE